MFDSPVFKEERAGRDSSVMHGFSVAAAERRFAAGGIVPTSLANDNSSGHVRFSITLLEVTRGKI